MATRSQWLLLTWLGFCTAWMDERYGERNFRQIQSCNQRKRNFVTVQHCINVIFNTSQACARVSRRKSVHFRGEGQEHHPEDSREWLRERERN